MIESASLTERIEKCERILKENTRSQVFASLADALRSKGDLDQAFRVCRQGIRIHPEYGLGHLVMAKVNFERKMYDWAEQELNEAVKLEGESRATEQLRIEILIAKGSIAEGQAALQRLKVSGANPLLIEDLQQRLNRQLKESKRRQIEQPLKAGKGTTASRITTLVEESRAASPITLNQALDELMSLSYVRSVVCAHTDGTVVDHRGDPEQDVLAMAAFGVQMCRAAEGEAVVGYFGTPLQIAIETEDRIIVLVKLSRYNVMFFCDKGFNLGSMRLKLDEIIGNLQDG